MISCLVEFFSRYGRLISEDNGPTLSILFILEYSEKSLGGDLKTNI